MRRNDPFGGVVTTGYKIQPAGEAVTTGYKIQATGEAVTPGYKVQLNRPKKLGGNPICERIFP